MVKARKELMFFNGVALSSLKLDELYLFEAELMDDLARHNDELENANKQGAETIAKYISNSIEYDTQKRQLVANEIQIRMSEVTV